MNWYNNKVYLNWLQEVFIIARKKGFTLIELLVVIAIIALLLSILTPALNSVKVRTRRIMCGNNLKQIGLAIFTYAVKNNDLLPTNREGGWVWDLSYEVSHFIMNTVGSNTGGKEGGIFFCPSDKTSIKGPDNPMYWLFSQTEGVWQPGDPIPEDRLFLDDGIRMVRGWGEIHERSPAHLSRRTPQEMGEVNNREICGLNRTGYGRNH